jgi:carbonic anhydrase/acetyltransferase-like protein (isoleucine patch superfamily)
MGIYQYKDKKPSLASGSYVTEGAIVIGDVEIGEDSLVLYHAVIRGDEGKITIGPRCNIQEHAVCHLYEEFPLVMEEEVSIGHHAVVHGCVLKKRVLVGMGATVMDGAVIGENSIIGAGAIVPPGKQIPPNSLVIGSPGKVVRSLTAKDEEMVQLTIDTYVRNAREFQDKEILKPLDVMDVRA